MQNVFSRIRVIARNLFPAILSDGNEAEMLADKLGRPVFTPYTIREMITTAVATLTNGTVTSFLAGSSDFYHDLVEITFGNQSTAAVTVSLLDDSSVVRTFQIPASSTFSPNLVVGLPQGSLGALWQLDMADVTGTTLNVGATFIKNR